jgi:hypothetical protein
VEIRDLAFVQTHAAEGVGWTPTHTRRASLPRQSAGGDFGSMIFDNLMFWGCHQGIRLGTVTTHSAGSSDH